MQKMKQYNMTISAIQDDNFHNTDFPKPDFPTEHGMQKMKQYNMTISAIQDVIFIIQISLNLTFQRNIWNAKDETIQHDNILL